MNRPVSVMSFVFRFFVVALAVGCATSTLRAQSTAPMPSLSSEPTHNAPSIATNPDAAIQNDKKKSEEGSVILALLVGIDGAIVEAKIEQSSGYAKLDEGAIEYAKTWKVKPATRDGKPVSAWWKVKVNFKLNDSDTEHKSESN